jgi:hypothetical protein
MSGPLIVGIAAAGIPLVIRLLMEVSERLPRPKRGKVINAAVGVAITRCLQIVESSPTWNKHKEGPLCSCEVCAYVRGNASEIRALLIPTKSGII